MENELSRKLKNILDKNGVKYRFIPLPENLPLEISSHAAFHKIGLDQAMATILYRTEKGLIAAVKRADTQIDQQKLKEIAKVNQLQFASDDDLISLGAESGMVPFLGLPVSYFIDAKILDIGQIYGTGGSKTLGMTMASKDMVRVNKGKIGDFTFFEKAKEILKKGGGRILSGITPSGDGTLHIGNYLGAVRQFIELAKNHDCFLFVADIHALTTVQNKEVLSGNIENLILNELALLGDLKNITFFRQSDVPFHTELQSILNNITPLGLIKRAHAYKDKLQKGAAEEDINMGLFSYPVLMSADILLYKPDLVPVGRDQKQHIEITRDIADRFNKTYKRKVFKLPDPYIPEEVAAVLGTDGRRKMSKSLGNIISIFEDEKIIKKQVMSTYTDPTRVHATDPGHIEGNMVFAYLDFFGGKDEVEKMKAEYQKGKLGDVEVKTYLFETLMKYFTPARKRYKELAAKPQNVKRILQDGVSKAREVAGATMIEVREAIGLTNSYSFFKY